MICMMLPITIVTCLCASNIVSIIYERGKFDGASVAMTSAALIGYALGFASMGVRDIILRGLYSFKNMKGPMITGIIAVAVNILFSVILSRFLGIMGITIASSISMTVNFIINSQMLKKHLPSYNFLAHIPVLLKQIPSIAFSLVVIMFIKAHVSNNILVFLLSAVIGIIGYGLILLLMRIEEVDYIKAKVLSKLPNRK